MATVTFSGMALLVWGPFVMLFLGLAGSLAWLIARQPRAPRVEVRLMRIPARAPHARAEPRRNRRPTRVVDGRAAAVLACAVVAASLPSAARAASSPLLAYWNDATPSRLVLGERDGVSPGSLVESEGVLVRGIGVPVVVRVDNGEYRVDDGPYTGAPGLVAPGQVVRVRHRAAVATGALTRTRLRIGEARSTFISRTR